MKRPQSIQINIPNPCSQSWDEMTPSGNGRHCAHCSTTVIDFTAWTDKELYNFFAGNKGYVCGRYLATQVGRPIHIPPQPHSRLYRMVVAMGLTLIFGGVAEGRAQSKVVALQNDTIKVMPAFGLQKDNIIRLGSFGVKGTVTDEKKEPITNASVAIFFNDSLKGATVTDIDGNYTIGLLQPGTYKIKASNFGYLSFGKTITISDVPQTVNVVLKVDKRQKRLKEVKITMGKKPLINPAERK
jgi:hypothetical protein